MSINDCLGSERTAYSEFETRGSFTANGEQLFETTGNRLNTTKHK